MQSRRGRFHGAERMALDARDLNQAANRLAGHGDVVLHAVRGLLVLHIAAALYDATPTSPWQPISALGCACQRSAKLNCVARPRQHPRLHSLQT
jgi:hypothetical protein